MTLPLRLFQGSCLALIALAVSPLRGAEPVVSTAHIAATEFRNQNGINTPTLDPHRPYRIGSVLQLEDTTPLDGRLESGARAWSYAKVEDNGLWLGADFRDLPSMVAAFPAGTYHWRVETETSPALAGELQLSPVAFPDAPRIAAGENTAWIGSRLVITDPSAGAVIRWQQPGPGVYEVFVTANGTDATLDPLATSYTLTAEAVDALPVETPVSCLVQFNSPSGHAATGVWLWVPRVEEERAYFTVARARVFQQDDNASPQPWTPDDAALADSDFGPHQFTMSGAAPGEVIGPGGKKFAMLFTYPGSALYNSGPYPTQAALDAEHPDGTYTLRDQSATLLHPRFPNNGTPVKLLSVNGRPPRWRSGKLLLDAKQDNTLVWSPWRPVRGLPFATRGSITMQFGYLSNASWQITEEAEAGFPADRKRPFNRHLLAANSLVTDRDYRLAIRYYLASHRDRGAWTAAGAAMVTYITVSPQP